MKLDHPVEAEQCRQDAPLLQERLRRGLDDIYISRGSKSTFTILWQTVKTKTAVSIRRLPAWQINVYENEENEKMQEKRKKAL